MIRAGRGWRPLLLAALVLVSVLGSHTSTWSAPGQTFDVRFGAVEAFRASAQADAAGVRWTRLVFWWSALQPDGPESWNSFYFPDDVLQAELDSGRQVVGLLLKTPDWAGTGGPTSVPQGLGLPLDHPDNHWARFARTMAERYKGRIDHWVVWNEPDVWDPQSPTYTWDGTVEDLYQLQKVAYLSIKRGNPNARVGLSGLTYWWDYFYERPQYFERYLQVAERDPSASANNWYFDAAVLHLYNEPAGLYRAPMLFKEVMAARGFSKSIWINETNVAPWDDPRNPMRRGDFRATLDEQASYLIQAFAYGLAAGAERISVYPMYDGDAPPGTELMGLVRQDGSTRPAYQALKTVTRYFSGVRSGTVERVGDAVNITLQKDGGTVTVAWSQAPRSAVLMIPAHKASARLIDKFGHESAINAAAGFFRLELDPATANTMNGDPSTYFIGGNPLILVE
jgi:hypothetical protein